MDKNKITRGFHKIGFKLKKHSPEILAVAGTVGVVTSAVLACKATTKASKIMDDHKNQVELVHSFAEDNGYSDEYTETDYKKDVTIIYAQTGVKLAKEYAPAVILGTVSIAAMLGSNHILRKRNIAISAAYAAVDKGFKDYRKNVIERFGEELDKELKFNLKAKEVEEVIVDEDGKEKTVKSIVNVVDPNTRSPYCVMFDDGNTGWDPDPEITKYFLFQTQNHANDMLKARGYLYLNEVYDMLGAPRTKAGQVVGWIYDEKNPIGDNFVSFGLDNIYDPCLRDFINGYEKVVLLDFNVDGNIWEMM